MASSRDAAIREAHERYSTRLEQAEYERDCKVGVLEGHRRRTNVAYGYARNVRETRDENRICELVKSLKIADAVNPHSFVIRHPSHDYDEALRAWSDESLDGENVDPR